MTTDDFTTMLKEIICIIEQVFSIGPISNNTYTNFIILHSFSKLQDMQFSIQDQLKMASKESLATPLTVLNYLHEKQKIIDSNSSARTATSIALAAWLTLSLRNSKSWQALFCTGCKSNTHTPPYCIHEEGGMAGKSIEESKVQRWKDMEATKGKAGTSTNGGGTGNWVPVAHMDLNSKAFISYVNYSAFYSSLDATAYANLTSINTNEVVLSIEDLEHYAFTIIHHIDVASIYLHSNFPKDDAPTGSPSMDHLPVKSTVFAMGWKEEVRADLEQAQSHKHQHQI